MITSRADLLKELKRVLAQYPKTIDLAITFPEDNDRTVLWNGKAFVRAMPEREMEQQLQNRPGTSTLGKAL